LYDESAIGHQPRILILGAGGHAQVVADILMRAHEAGSNCKPIGFLDDNPSLTGTAIMSLPVQGTIAQLDEFDHNAVIAPGVHLGGDVTIGEGTLVRIGATVIPQRTVGEWSVIGAGSVVNKDIPAHATAAGAPARVIQQGRGKGETGGTRRKEAKHRECQYVSGR
jgi:UDP-3-O-[3-hydroxymyristoyl] glucosamine N-acyltransferase